MNIFTRGLNYLKNFFSREEPEQIPRITETAQTTPSGFFTQKATDPSYLKFDVGEGLGDEKTKVAKETLKKSAEIAERERATGLLPDITELEHQNIFINLSTRQAMGEKLTEEQEFQREKSQTIALRGYADALLYGEAKPTRLFLKTIRSKIAKSSNIDEIFKMAKNIFDSKPDSEVMRIADDLVNIKKPELVEQYIKKVDSIEPSVVQILDTSTGKMEYKTIQKGELDSFSRLIDDTKAGISGQDIDGKVYHLTAKTPGQMGRAGAELTGMAKLKEIPVNKLIEVREKAYNINLNKLDMTPVQKNAYEARIEKLRPQLELAKGKKLTNDEVLQAAKESDLMTKVFTRAETAEQIAQITKARQRVTELSGLIEKTDDITTKSALIQEQMELSKVISSQAADAGRKLQAYNITAEGVDAVRIGILKRLGKITDDTKALADRAAKVDWTKQNEVNRFYREYVNPTFREVFDEYRYNNMLSNPRTFERNLISSLFSAGFIRPTTKFVEAGVDLFSSKLTGKEREVFFREVPVYYREFFGSIPQAWDNFIDVWKGTAGVTNKDLELVTGRGAMEAFLKNKLKLNEKVARRVANTFNIPTKGMESVDQMLMKMVSEGELAALRKRGVDELTAVKEANEIAKYSLFRAGLDTTDKAAQGKLLSAIDSGIQAVDQLRSSRFGRATLLDWFVPFIRTPMNFAKQWIEYSPAGLFTLPGNTNKKAQIAKTLIGTTIVGLGAQKAFNDETTWGVPTDPTERELFFAANRRPYSFEINGYWVPMMYLGPWAYALALPAAFKYYQEDSKKALTDGQVAKIGKAVGSMGEFLSRQTFLEGIGNFVDTVKGDPNQSIEKTLAFTGGQTVPWQGLVRYISTIVDKVYRKSTTFSEAMQKDLPFLSKKLESYRLPTGEESTRNISSYVAPYDISKEREEYGALLEQRQEQLQINNLLRENDKGLNKEAMEIVVIITETESKKELQGAIEKIKGNVQLKNTVESLLKKQAMYTTATLEPLMMFSNNPSALADIIYGRILLAETKTEMKENVIDFIEELKVNGLYNDKVKAALNRLILKESEQEEFEKE